MDVQRKKLNTKQGLTLFIAVSIAALVLILVLNILAIAIKELQISGFLRESQEAFYGADAGMECALYHDIFGGGDPFPEPGEGAGPATIDCLGDNMSVSYTFPGTSAVSTFALRFSNTDDSTSCAEVTITKDANLVTVESRGVNKHDASVGNCNAASGQTQRVERALRATYPY